MSSGMVSLVGLRLDGWMDRVVGWDISFVEFGGLGGMVSGEVS